MAHLPQVFLFVCPRINILLCSLTYVSVMRSMTQSSADTSSIASFPPSATPPPSHVLNPVPISHTSHPTHRDTLASSQPQLPPLPQHSFFDIANDSILFSPQSKHHITRAIQNGWADSTVKRYSGSIKQFIRFCNMEGIPNHLRFPADEFVLLHYRYYFLHFSRVVRALGGPLVTVIHALFGFLTRRLTNTAKT